MTADPAVTTDCCDACGHRHPNGPCRTRAGWRRCGCTTCYLCACGHIHTGDCPECGCRDWGRSEWIPLLPGGSTVSWTPVVVALLALLVVILWTV